jgi:hypothetical protein
MDLRFDWFPELEKHGFTIPVGTVCDLINHQRSSRGQSIEQIREIQEKERRFAKQLITALYGANYTLPFGTSRVSLPLTTAFYSSSPYSHSVVRRVFEAISQLDWVGSNKGKEGVGYTRIWAANGLAGQFETIGFKWFPQVPNPHENLVVLRDYESEGSKNKTTIATPETAEVNSYRHFLYTFNSFLLQHCIALDIDDQQLTLLAQKMTEKASEEAERQPWLSGTEKQSLGHLDFSRVQLARIFARGSMTKGGRFYRGWWQSLPSLYRPHITINGLKTCEVDFSGMAIGIMYAQIGVQFPLDHDPYDIGLDDWQGKKDPRRKLIKEFFNALINDETGRYRLKREELEIVGVSHHELIGKIHEAHGPISNKLSTGAGLDTQFIDSEIASYVMHKMMEQGVLVLPIHDSFIVRLGYEAELNQAMLEAYNHYTKFTGKVSADYARLPEHFGINNDEFENEQERLRGESGYGIVGVDDLKEQILQERTSIMDGYVGSWEEWKTGAN